MYLWEIATGRQVRRYSAYGELTFTPDGKRFLAADHGHDYTAPITATMFETSTGRSLCEVSLFYQYFGAPNRPTALSPDGRLIVTVGQTGQEQQGRVQRFLTLWDSDTGQRLRTFGDPDTKIYKVDFSKNNREVLAEEHDGTTTHWDVRTGTKIRSEVSANPIRSIPNEPVFPISPTRKYVLEIDGHRVSDGTKWNGDITAVCDATNGHVLIKSTGHLTDVRDVRVGQSDHMTIQTGLPGKMSSLSVEGGTMLNIMRFHANGVLSPDERLVAEGGGDLTLYDATTGEQLFKLGKGREFDGCLAFTPDSRYLLAVATSDKAAILWDLSTQQIVKSLGPFHGTRCHNHVAVSPDARYVFASGTYDLSSEAYFWDVATGKRLVFNCEESNTDCRLGAFSQDSHYLAIGKECLRESAPTLWETAAGQEVRTFEPVKWLVCKSMIFSPDGRELLAAGDGGVCIWEVSSGRLLRTFKPEQRIESASFTADSRRVFVTMFGRRGVIAWDIATGDELARFFLLDDGREWLTTSHEGLFDGSKTARDLVCFRVGGGLNVVPVERFFRDFYRPGLLAAIMRGERPMPEVEMGKQLPPAVCITTPKQGGDTEEKTVAIEAVVEDKGGGIKSPWVMQNNTRVIVENKPVKEGNRLRWKFELPLVSGENTIEVQSASADGSWESEPAKISFVQRRPTEDSDLYLLAIGVSKYAGESHNLQYAAADATAFTDLFRKHGEQSYGKGRVHVQTLIDADATVQKIRAAVEDIAKKAHAQDVFILTLSGHGVMVGQRYFFLPHEFTGKGEGGWEERVKRQGLPGDALQTWINGVPALKRVVVYDTCQSGGAVAVAGLSRDPFQFQRAFETFRRSTGCHVIAAATATQEAQEIRDLGHGALTYALLAGLGEVDRGPLKSRSITTKDGLIHVREWLTFAQENVPMLTKLYYGHEQMVDVFAEGRSFPVIKIDANNQQPASSEKK